MVSQRRALTRRLHPMVHQVRHESENKAETHAPRPSNGPAKTPWRAAAEDFAHHPPQIPCRRMNQQAFEDIGMAPQVNSPDIVTT